MTEPSQSGIERLLAKLNDLAIRLERRIGEKWVRRIDLFNRWTWNAYVVLFALAGAAIAGWALARSIWGIVFAIPVGLGAYLVLKYARGER